MWVGTLELDLLLGGAGPAGALAEGEALGGPAHRGRVARRFAVAAAEAGTSTCIGGPLVGVAVVAADRAHCVEVLDRCERLVAERPEIELLSAGAAHQQQ